MASSLRITRVRLDGTSWPHVWDFPHGVTVIVGAVGGGKTSLLNLIKFGLGGDAPITAEITKAATSVTLDVRVGDSHLTLTRGFDDNVVLVGEGNETQHRYALRRGSKHPRLSDLLLDSLGIPAIRVPQSRTGRSHRLTSISFQDVFAYCYLDQEQVDRSTVYDNDRFRGPKREWTFELLHGIIDREIAELETTSETLLDKTEQREKRLIAVEDFASEQSLSLQSETIASRVTQLDVDEIRLRSEIETAHRDGEQAASVASQAQAEAAHTEEELIFALAEHRRMSVEFEGVRRAANQLRRDVAFHREGNASHDILGPLPYLVCPRCEQHLDSRPHQKGHCVVCLQLDPPVEDADGAEQLRRLSEQQEETHALQTQLVQAEAEARATADRLATELRERRTEIRRTVHEATAPHLERATKLQEDMGALRGERLALLESRPVAAAVRVERETLQAAGPEIAQIQDRAKARRGALNPARNRVEELSRAFDEILHLFTLPWLKTAEVDRENYLPKVNGRDLRTLSSGGMKATTNVAYYLAVLVTALRDREVLTPSFLMLDSIRKDYGAGEKDLARAERIYSYLRTLQDMRHTPSGLGADFQLLVVDNDLPAQFEHSFNTILIDPDRPLVRIG